jgi:MtN3 and saliva related transmembrane protein
LLYFRHASPDASRYPVNDLALIAANSISFLLTFLLTFLLLGLKLKNNYPDFVLNFGSISGKFGKEVLSPQK